MVMFFVGVFMMKYKMDLVDDDVGLVNGLHLICFDGCEKIRKSNNLMHWIFMKFLVKTSS